MSGVPKSGKLFLGTIIHSESLIELKILNGFIAVKNGKIIAIGPIELSKDYSTVDFELIKLTSNQFLIPGLIDCHVHAPQFPNLGIGLDKPLLEWLEAYTFPLEKKYEDIQFATRVYRTVVSRLLKNGTTTACYFGSLHLEGTLQLAKTVIEFNQRALVGKVSMNRPNDANYYNSTEKEIEESEEFIKEVIGLKSDIVDPIITPRFAISCNLNVMTKLAELATKYDCRIQSHISENCGEIQYMKELYPESRNYADVYEKAGLLTDKCIMAHGVHLTSDEIYTLSQRGVSIAHCPASNTRLASGMCPVRKLLDGNITIGLGTDVSGGDSASILDTIRRAMDVSTHLDIQGEKEPALTLVEAFYLATLGGAKALNLDNKIGNFKIGKEFDALVIDIYNRGSAIDEYGDAPSKFSEKYAMELLQRFVHLGDDRNISQVYVQGRESKWKANI